MLQKKMMVAMLLIGITSLSSRANAQATIKIMIAGSSAMWKSLALSTYNIGACPPGNVGGCKGNHYASSGFNLNDTRPIPLGGALNVDPGAIWIIWDNKVNTAGQPTPDVWAFIKVDSGVGDRCYFAQPRCNVTTPGPWLNPPVPNLINPSLWGDNSADVNPPAVVQALFLAAAGPLVSAAATDIRPEDALFATCRANSALDAAHPLAPLGLGYNPNNPVGDCPAPSGTGLANLVGKPIFSAVSPNLANLLAFNIAGKDPFTGRAIPIFTTVSLGAAPLVFVAQTGVNGSLTPVTDITDFQLQNVFAGNNCNAALFGAPAGGFDFFELEPLSGVMNTAEFDTFLYPDFDGISQEAGVNPGLAGNNPLNLACGPGSRQRGVGTSDVTDRGVAIDAVNDSLTYTFSGYGNFFRIADDNGGKQYRYLRLDGVDPIFHRYIRVPLASLDPGQPNATTGEIPGVGDLAPCPGAAFPCPENKLWIGGLSYPNVRSGQYRAWAIWRLVSDGATLATAKSLVALSQGFTAKDVPDYIPAVSVTANAGIGFTGDPGLVLLRSHYQQVDGSVPPVQIGKPPVNGGGAVLDVGGEMGGCIEHATPGNGPETDTVTRLIQQPPLADCDTFVDHSDTNGMDN